MNGFLDRGGVQQRERLGLSQLLKHTCAVGAVDGRAIVIVRATHTAPPGIVLFQGGVFIALDRQLP